MVVTYTQPRKKSIERIQQPSRVRMFMDILRCIYVNIARTESQARIAAIGGTPERKPPLRAVAPRLTTCKRIQRHELAWPAPRCKGHVAGTGDARRAIAAHAKAASVSAPLIVIGGQGCRRRNRPGQLKPHRAHAFVAH